MDRKLHHANKKINQYTVDGKYVNTYESTSLASEAVGCHKTTITHTLKSGKTAKGCIWKYY